MSSHLFLNNAMVCLYKVGNHLSVGKWESCQKHIRPLGGFSHYSHCSFIFIYYPVGAMSMWCRLEHSLASLTEEESATSGGSSFLFFLFFVLLILILLLLTLFILITCTGCREVEETGLLSESDRMLSKTILVPGANHAQVFS